MIPQALQERAEPLGLKITRVKDRSSMFRVEVPDERAWICIFWGSSLQVETFLRGVQWAVEREAFLKE